MVGVTERGKMPNEVQEKLGIDDNTFYRNVKKLKDENLAKQKDNGKYVALDLTSPEPMGWEIDEVVKEVLSEFRIRSDMLDVKESDIKDTIGDAISRLWDRDR